MHKHKLVQVVIGAAGVAAILLPVAALARDGEDSQANPSINIISHIETGDGSDGESANATTSVRIHEENGNDNSDVNNHGGEASTTKHHHDKQDESLTSQDESDGGDNEIEIDHESADNATTTIDTAEHVTNRGELRSFLNHIVKEDDRISDVHISSSTIETHYKIPAKLLWAIPMNMTVDVSVNNNGSVSVTYPWYAFLFATHGDMLATQLQQSAIGTGTTTSSANAQAQLLNLLFLKLKASVE